MLFTLVEVLHQIDPHVELDDGLVARTVEQILFSADPNDTREYVIRLDSAGRILILAISGSGYVIDTPVFVEIRSSVAISASIPVRSAPTISAIV